MRIAIGGIHTECSTYSPAVMTAADFRVLRGEAIVADPGFAFLKVRAHICQPLVYARATPGGPIRRDAYEGFKTEFLDRLTAALPLDGLHLVMHGAMHVVGMEDAEADWIAGARDVVGDECILAASYDLHGNVSQRIVDQLDAFAAYRTAPHLDEMETRARAFGMIVDALDRQRRPGVAWAPIPVLLPGERTSTVDEPARSLYGRLAEIDRQPGILDANLMVGYVWADEARATAAAVVTGTDRDAMSRACESLAASYWEAREAFTFGPETGSLDAMLDYAATLASRPVILADSGDNPTGGGVGDRIDVLKALMARGWSDAVVAGIADRPATEACFAAGAGTRKRLRIGGTLGGSEAIELDAEVVRLDDGSDPTERQAVVQAGGIAIVLSARRRPYHRIADFTRLGLSPATARLLVVKSGYLSPELASLANPNLMALTDGVVGQDIAGLASRRRVQPIYPWHSDFEWAPHAVLSARMLR